jgi:hypothetical protein
MATVPLGERDFVALGTLLIVMKVLNKKEKKKDLQEKGPNNQRFCICVQDQSSSGASEIYFPRIFGASGESPMSPGKPGHAPAREPVS